MMTRQNHAAWLKSKEHPELVVEEAPYSAPGSDEVVIRNKAVAINPIEKFIQQTGILITGYPSILGSDVAGVIEEVGSGLELTYNVGDRVIGRANRIIAPKYAGFQEYVVLSPPLLAKIPDQIKFTDAVVLPAGITTAAYCLFEPGSLALELPPSQGGQGKTLLIWGASSTIGLAGIQLAVASGYEVVAIASSHNFDLLKSLGAIQCFDRRSNNVVDEVVTYLEGKEVVGAYDTVSKEQTIVPLCEILHRSGGRKLIEAILFVDEGIVRHDIVVHTNMTLNAQESPAVSHIWKNVLGPGLASGAIKCKPDAEIVGSGLEDIQKGIDLHAQGVSAKKLVITLDK